MDMECKHKSVYYGVVNIRQGRSILGAIDVWHCIKCERIFAEEKRLGILDIASDVGMPSIREDEDWFILTCRLSNEWALVKVKNDGNGRLVHKCIDGEIMLEVKNFKIDDDHRLLPLKECINREVYL